MKKKVYDFLAIIMTALAIFILATVIFNLFVHDWSDSAFLSMALCCGIGYVHYKDTKKNKNDFLTRCNTTYYTALTYIMACMQQPSWAPNITVPTNINLIATPCFPVLDKGSFITTLIMRSVNRAPLTSLQLTQVRQILNTDLQTAIQNGYIQCRNINVGFPINNNNAIHVTIEVFV